MSYLEGLDPERALIGAVLVQPKLIREVEDVDAADFRDPRLEALWGLMLWLDQNRMAPEPVTVFDNLHRIDIPIDPILIHEIHGSAPVGALVRVYGNQVVNGAILRRLNSAGVRIAQLTEDGQGDARELQEEARAQIDQASRHIAEVHTVSETIDATIDDLEAPTSTSIPTPWPDLNYLIRGWRPGALYVIGARPAVGKSIMGMQAAASLSRHGWVSLHSLEMPRDELNKRLLAALGDVALSRMDDKTLTPRDWEHIAKARADIATLRLSIDDRSSVRVLDIRSYARTLARRGDLAGIVVDYLQLMSASHGDRRQRWELVGEWSRQLKILAKELAIPVIVLSQLNREVAGRADKRPTMTDLKESGSIEQDADVILLLHVDEEKDPSVMDVGIAKNRHGRTGRITLERRGDIARLDPQRWTPGKAATP